MAWSALQTDSLQRLCIPLLITFSAAHASLLLMVLMHYEIVWN